ncbi:MAG: hypothetical protein K0Q79_2300 [Flavipsychrobacter sp.]|jgi:hypothetical protein|nr:hypothetical protein [Flavipsychrobacter sp.]
MRTFTLLFSALVLGTTAMAQPVATFESLSLSTSDTFYVNYSAPGTDVGFNNGLAHFPCVYDTSSWGDFWSYGFAYSNMTDSVTSGFTNQYSAKTAIGYGGSSQYAVSWGQFNKVILLGGAVGQPVQGFYVTNSTYTYNSMRDGDMFARKFHNGDWFKLTVQGYSGGVLQPTMVTTYLANFLFPDTTMNYILKDWQWVNLASLGPVDSLEFSLSSTDNGMWGMNTPAYFCIDNFTTNDITLGVANTPMSAAKVYPNPATNMLYVDVADNAIQQVQVTDMAGRVMSTYSASAHIEINTSTLPAGMYMLQMSGNGKAAAAKFVKE